MNTYLIVGGIMLVALLAIAAFLHLLSRLGGPGRAMTAWFSVAPGLDLVVASIVAAPLVVGPIVAGWIGLASAVTAQVLSLLIWSNAHDLAHPKARKGPRIVKVLNSLVGAPRNHFALWATMLVIPLFIIVRAAEILVYPMLVWSVRFPRYPQREWIRISRHKFENLVGHDLIWCLYCDWMTGVWSLGSEMLRNVESFWCPIRFDNTKKCDNCRHDFPDVYQGWVPADGTMDDVTKVLRKHYGDDTINSWFGHPARLTIDGNAIDRR
jgi:hypothetical protein